MPHDIDVGRRRLIQSAALTVAASQLCGSALSHAQSNPSKGEPSSSIGIGAAPSSGALKQVDAGALRIGYAGAGHPSITLAGDANGTPQPDADACAKKFVGNYAHRVIEGGVGHNLPQVEPRAFAKAVIEVDRA